MTFFEEMVRPGTSFKDENQKLFFGILK